MGRNAQILQQLSGQVLVSVQADQGEPFEPIEPFMAMAKSALNGGAAGLRLAGKTHIQAFKSQYPNVPVIGITKPVPLPENYYDHVYITPTLADACQLFESGADIVAMDATARPRAGGESLKEIVTQARERFPDGLLMADIATLSDGVAAAALGFDLVATTLSGYTTETQDQASDAPDVELLKALVSQISVPVIMEGRLQTPDQVRQAFYMGAYAVVIGSAITRPHLLTRAFVQYGRQPS